ncbi:hypothetical protein [Nocardioides psychrotolerans]|nr:hypothetical protein [Nocardioides psychrotolerans]
MPTSDALALSVHGPAGVLDLLIPSGASVADVAVEYADKAGLGSVPALCTPLGRRLTPDQALKAAGVGSGSVLVALLPGGTPALVPGHRRTDDQAHRHAPPGALSVLWFSVAVGLALVAGWSASQEPPSDLRTTTVVLLGAAAFVGILPVGRYAAHRILAAPVFAAAAAFVVAWDPAPERLPTIIGVAALTGAVTAALARALDRHSEEALRVWVVVGSLVFVITCGAALLDFRPQVAWALLLLLATLAARFVPSFAIDVPDQFLIDLERLAVTAWSARDRPTGRRGRIVVPSRAVELVAARGTRIVTASAAAILAVVVVSAPLLLEAAAQRHDWWGARAMVGFSGVSLLFAARSYRHVGARALLRAAGLVCLLVLLVVVLVDGGAGTDLAIGVVAPVLAGTVILLAVPLGRGWRSAWWSRRAEVAESICASFAVGAVVVAVGLFRHLWELTG